jgi:hypothetical protein
VIGNPPYIRIQTMKEWAPLEVEAYKQLYGSARSGNYDIYVVFAEKGLILLNQLGRLGYILPHKFFNAQYGKPLRTLLAKGKHLSHVVHFGDQQVFDGATTYTCLMFADKAGRDECQFIQVDDLKAWRTIWQATEGTIPAINIKADEWNFVVGEGAALFERLGEMQVKLGDVAERMAQGIRTSANEVYVLDLVHDDGNIITAHSKILDCNVRLECKAVFMFLQGREIRSYRVLPSGKVVIVPYMIQNGRPSLIPETEIQKRFPLLYVYLNANKDYLSARENGHNADSENPRA